jgi:hypothetical protein
MDHAKDEWRERPDLLGVVGSGTWLICSAQRIGGDRDDTPDEGFACAAARRAIVLRRGHLFAGGAINAVVHGLHQTMQLGLGAAAALAVAADAEQRA